MKKIFFISLISLCVFAITCCHSKNKSTNPGTKEPDFALQVIPQTQWVTAGQFVEFQIKLISLNGFSAACTLSMFGFPEEDSLIFESKVLEPPDSFQITINTTFSTPRDTYQLTVTGKNENLIHDSQALLVVSPEKVTDYYPLAIGNAWKYALLDHNGKTLMTFWYKIVDTMTVNGNFGYLFGGLGFLYAKGDTIFSKEGRIILAGPLVIGQTWTVQSWNYELIEFGAVTLTEGTEYENCIKLEKTDPVYPGAKEYEWWAKNVGIVKWDTYAYGLYQGTRELVIFIHD